MHTNHWIIEQMRKVKLSVSSCSISCAVALPEHSFQHSIAVELFSLLCVRLIASWLTHFRLIRQSPNDALDFGPILHRHGINNFGCSRKIDLAIQVTRAGLKNRSLAVKTWCVSANVLGWATSRLELLKLVLVFNDTGSSGSISETSVAGHPEWEV